MLSPVLENLIVIVEIASNYALHVNTPSDAPSAPKPTLLEFCLHCACAFVVLRSAACESDTESVAAVALACVFWTYLWRPDAAAAHTGAQYV